VSKLPISIAFARLNLLITL